MVDLVEFEILGTKWAQRERERYYKVLQIEGGNHQNLLDFEGQMNMKTIYPHLYIVYILTL